MAGEAIRVKVYRAPGARLPERSTPGSAGYDLHASLPPDTRIVIPPGERIDVPTGLYFEIPSGYCITLRPRSGLAKNHGVTLLNSPATIDSDYRGELRVLLINLGHEPVSIDHHDRIAQLMVERLVDLQWDEVPVREDLEATHRGEGGFGSTGIKHVERPGGPSAPQGQMLA